MAKDPQRHSEAKQLYQEALSLRRQLAKDNPQTYLPEVATTLDTYGLTLLNWKDMGKAASLLKEATELLSPLAKQYPSIYGDQQAYALYLASRAVQNNVYTCQTMQEILVVVQTNKAIKQAAQLTLELCKKGSCPIRFESGSGE